MDEGRGQVRKKYWWLYIPVISWLFFVFPLLFALPLGPIILGVAFSRRRLFSFYKKGCEHLGEKEKDRGIAYRTYVNFYDILTLGLSQLFATARLLREMIQQDGTEAERSQIDPLLWCWKWLGIANVAFIAIYVICPGIVYEPLLSRLEGHLGRQ